MIERWLYTAKRLSGQYGKNEGMERTNDEEEAVLRSSIVKKDKTGIGWMDDKEVHAPAIDIDMNCELIPSSTEGHYHLYIDKEMPWENYLELLTVMNKVGIVQDGFLKLAKDNGMTLLRVRHKNEDPGKLIKVAKASELLAGWSNYYPCELEVCELCKNWFTAKGFTDAQFQALWEMAYGENALDIPPNWKLDAGVLVLDFPDGPAEVVDAPPF